MKHTYYSPLFSMYTQIAGAVPEADKPKINIINPVFSRVGIKFDNSSDGKLYPGEFGIKKYSWFDAERDNGLSVMCQSTFL